VFQGAVQLSIEVLRLPELLRQAHNAPFTLAHEQVHFDMGTYARHLIKPAEQAPNTEGTRAQAKGKSIGGLCQARLMPRQIRR